MGYIVVSMKLWRQDFSTAYTKLLKSEPTSAIGGSNRYQQCWIVRSNSTHTLTLATTLKRIKHLTISLQTYQALSHSSHSFEECQRDNIEILYRDFQDEDVWCIICILHMHIEDPSELDCDYTVFFFWSFWFEVTRLMDISSVIWITHNWQEKYTTICQ